MKHVPLLNKADVAAFLDKFSKALVKGDEEVIAKCFELPAVFVSDDTVQPLTEASKMKGMFAEGRKFYSAHGIVDTHPEVEEFERISDRLYEARVRWPGFDKNKNEVWTESSKYILRVDDKGEPRIRVAATLGGNEA